MLIGKRALSVLYSFLVNHCRPGDRFVLPVNICPSVYWCFIKTGVEVSFCDIDSTTLCIDFAKARDIARRHECRGLLFNHTYGCSFFPKEDLASFRRDHDECFIIDDRCLCLPEIDESKVGLDASDLTLYSTGHAKCVDLGHGGYGFLSDRVRNTELVQLPYREADEKMMASKNKNRTVSTKGEISHMNWLDTEIDFAVDTYMHDLMAETSRIIEHKAELNGIYYRELEAIDKLSCDFNFWRFNVLVQSQSAVIAALFDHGLFASTHYVPVESSSEQFPVAQELSKSIVNLFNDRYFTARQASDCAKVINLVVNSGRRM